MPEVPTLVLAPTDMEAYASFQEERAALESIFARSPEQHGTDKRSQEALHFARLIDSLIAEYRSIFQTGSVNETPELARKTCLLWERLIDSIESVQSFEDILHPSYLNLIEELHPFALVSSLMSKGYSLIISCFRKRISDPNELVFQCRQYAEGLELLSAYVKACMQYPEVNSSRNVYNDVYPFSDYLLRFVVGPIPLNRSLLTNSIMQEIEHCFERIRIAAKEISSDIFKLNNFIVDYLDDEIIYVNPNSAEGKAIRRGQQSFDEVKWIVVDDDKEPEPLEVLFSRLKTSG